jgi:trans-aconitate methyltransferase
MGTALVPYLKHRIKSDKTKQLRTICEVLREMYRSSEEKQDLYMMTRIDECYDMAKRMQRKLQEYKFNDYIVSNRK